MRLHTVRQADSMSKNFTRWAFNSHILTCKSSDITRSLLITIILFRKLLLLGTLKVLQIKNENTIWSLHCDYMLCSRVGLIVGLSPELGDTE